MSSTDGKFLVKPGEEGLLNWSLDPTTWYHAESPQQLEDGVNTGHVKSAFRHAGKLIGEYHRWCQNQFATKLTVIDDGAAVKYEPCPPHSEFAVCWCLTGALRRVTGWDGLGRPPVVHTAASAVLDAGAREWGYGVATKLNDTANHQTVMALLARSFHLPPEEVHALYSLRFHDRWQQTGFSGQEISDDLF